MSTKPFVILGKEVKPGESAFLEMEVAKLHTRNRLRITVIVERAKEEGPTLLLLGGVHGDEINGVSIIREIIGTKMNKPIKGTIICIPVFNVFGFLNQTREFPDGRDLNRMFPGSPNGSLASQFAYKFTKEIAPLVDYVIDFHTGGDKRENIPNVRCDRKNEESLAMAKAFGAPFILHSPEISKSVRSVLSKMGKKSIVFEGGKALSLNKKVLQSGVDGALNVMRYLGMQPAKNKPEQTQSVFIEKSKWIRAQHSGIFKYNIKNGDQVKKRQKLGAIIDPYGELEKPILAPFDCFIFGLNTAPIVHKGDALFHVSDPST
ncbi:MAG: succinylglutamate desuccinylase [Flavobacteriaceae bacterium]|nr:MAG: succinylglutamate desuccinylase [Flavobacteriaceae bacterium]